MKKIKMPEESAATKPTKLLYAAKAHTTGCQQHHKFQ